jgi:hypothetical protein
MASLATCTLPTTWRGPSSRKRGNALKANGAPRASSEQLDPVQSVAASATTRRQILSTGLAAAVVVRRVGLSTRETITIRFNVTCQREVDAHIPKKQRFLNMKCYGEC